MNLSLQPRTQRVLLLVMAMLFCLASPSELRAGCKPDFSGRDNLTKQPVDRWNQVLSSSGFMAAALLDNDVTFTASIMRNGARTYVILIFEKVEENLARAAFESHYHASK